MKKIVLSVFIIFGLLTCEELIEVSDISEVTVTLVAPTDAVVLSETNTLFFDWEAVDEAETYRIQIATPTFAEAVQIVADSIFVGTTFSTTLSVNDYEWRVRAENSGYETAYTTQSFTVE